MIAGRACPPATDAYIEDRCPATNAVIARIPRSGTADVATAARAARAAFEGPWASWSQAERADLLDAIADKIDEHKEELAELESLDTGKPIRLATTVDIPRAAKNFRFFAGAIRHDSTECHSMPGALNYTIRKPAGVAGLITPWNLPLYLLTWKLAPALAMGNTVIAKPSELTPLTASRLAELIDDLDIPEGVFNLVHGYGAEAGQAIVEHPDVSLISFTGGTVTGRKVAATAAPLFKKLSLELGGKNPTLVFADADFDQAVAGALRAGFLNQGQVCLCGSRILVEASIYERFEAALIERVNALAIGDPSEPATEMGALISLEHREKVESYIELARSEGGVVRAGGSRPDLPPRLSQGAFLRPTVVTGLDPGCRTATEEIFGPLVTLHPFEDEAEAIRIANGVRYGLCASVWTQDLTRAHRVSAALETGMVWVNTWLLRDLRVPFGGVKDSGVGREGGRYSLEFFSESRNVCIKL
ncbi:MAG: aldehyde dehydrogenase [Planctomycetota bacterium]|jgi:aminomuconate-semialdehyde/2-hydroxymuconate-6-semialdehyde dehydrogenase